MIGLLNLEEIDLLKLARSIERDCQEGVKWERRKLQWIIEEERGSNETATNVICLH